MYFYLPFSLVAINLIVQHIQDILNGGFTKRQNGFQNGHGTPRQRHPSESVDLTDLTVALASIEERAELNNNSVHPIHPMTMKGCRS